MRHNDDTPAMNLPTIDDSRILSAIMAAGVRSAKAVEAGSELVDAWAAAVVEADSRYRTLGLEVGWFTKLGPGAFVVGCVDKLAVERPDPAERAEYEAYCSVRGSEPTAPEPFVLEAKTTAPASRFWTPEKWYDEIARGHQVGTYAMALRWGTFIQPASEPVKIDAVEWTPGVAAPRVLVRAVSKSRPPQIWPGPEGAWVEVGPARLDATRSAYVNAAAAIRAQRATGVVPWQLPGRHCTKQYGTKAYPCTQWSVCHDTREYPRGERVRGLSPGSAGVVAHLVATGRVRPDDPGVVVLSSSSLDSWAQCPEKWRQEAAGAGGEESEALDTGTVFHAGIAEFQRILKEAGY